jgi:hypothetical protein
MCLGLTVATHVVFIGGPAAPTVADSKPSSLSLRSSSVPTFFFGASSKFAAKSLGSQQPLNTNKTDAQSQENGLLMAPFSFPVGALTGMPRNTMADGLFPTVPHSAGGGSAAPKIDPKSARSFGKYGCVLTRLLTISSS